MELSPIKKKNDIEEEILYEDNDERDRIAEEKIKEAIIKFAFSMEDMLNESYKNRGNKLNK